MGPDAAEDSIELAIATSPEIDPPRAGAVLDESGPCSCRKLSPGRWAFRCSPFRSLVGRPGQSGGWSARGSGIGWRGGRVGPRKRFRLVVGARGGLGGGWSGPGGRSLTGLWVSTPHPHQIWEIDQLRQQRTHLKEKRDLLCPSRMRQASPRVRALVTAPFRVTISANVAGVSTFHWF
jgi:hypothetical protein